MENVSRRNFLRGTSAALAGAAVAGLTLTGCTNEQPAERPSWLPESWDYETDIAVVGMGAAGLSAAIAALDEGLGDVLVLEAAPEEYSGGNTRVSMNLIMIPKNVDKAIEYQNNLNDYCVVEDDLVRSWAENICENKEWMEGFGMNLVAMQAYSPEFPDVAGSECAQTYCIDGIAGNASGWLALKEEADYLGAEYLYSHRALSLVRDPLTNEALGVVADNGGASVTIKARKGVILACGGFENNMEMMREYLNVGSEKHPYGTPYNRGDGFAMVAPFGAKLWHMNNASGTVINGYVQGVGDDELTNNITGTMTLGVGSLPIHTYMFVGRDGKRFMYEEKLQLAQHGKVPSGGMYVDMPTPVGTYAIFDSTVFDNVPIFVTAERGATAGWAVIMDSFVGDGSNQAYLDAGVIVKADTIDELAAMIPVDSAGLVETVNSYNQLAMAGKKDPEFGRGTTVYETHVGFGDSAGESEDGQAEAVAEFALQPLARGPFYAMPIAGSIVNTQGGPKRDVNGQLVDWNDEPIGRLFGAGEFGTIYGYCYNGGGNVSEAISSGRLAARSAGALEPWDADDAQEKDGK